MTRKQAPARRRWPAQPPRGLRPKLAPGQVLDLSLVHHINLDTVVTGQADGTVLWHLMGGALTWSHVASKLGHGEQAMAEQLQMLEAVAARFIKTGRVGFTGLEYQTAKRGVMLQDELAAAVDQQTAIEAALWSEQRINQMFGQQDDQQAA